VWTGPLEPIDGNNNPSAPPVSNAMGNDEQALLDTALMHAAEQGKTLFASTGDAGAYCDAVYPPTNTNGVTYGGDPDVEYPAASAFAVAVGGTVLFTDDGAPPPVSSGSGVHRVDEHAWEYGGGGPSHFEPAWFYQTANNHAFSQAVVPCLSSPAGSPTGTGLQCRALPDVAAQSGDVFTLNGYDIWTGGSMCDGCGGGTSLSSPLWAGMWTRIQSSNPDANGYGYANALLYALGEDATAGPRDFTDVTVGNNGMYNATPGWDYVSGFGTPNVANIITDAAKVAPFTAGANLPEAPVAVLLPAAGLAMVVGAGYVRRRRRHV
jgi:subtilase family serine protease